MKESHFEDLFRRELEDLYGAEKQMVAALPKMVAAASTADLATAFEGHLEQTREHVKRLDRIFEQMGEEPIDRPCEGMQGLVSDSEKRIAEMEKSPVLDAALIAAAQRIEHYEISAYNTVRTMAEMLGQPETSDLLNETLQEEKDTDEELSDIAEAILNGDTMVEQED